MFCSCLCQCLFSCKLIGCLTIKISDNKGPDTRQRNARKSQLDNNQPNSSLSTPQTPLKLTLKIGGQTLGEKWYEFQLNYQLIY